MRAQESEGRTHPDIHVLPSRQVPEFRNGHVTRPAKEAGKDVPIDCKMIKYPTAFDAALIDIESALFTTDQIAAFQEHADEVDLAVISDLSRGKIPLESLSSHLMQERRFMAWQLGSPGEVSVREALMNEHGSYRFADRDWTEERLKRYNPHGTIAPNPKYAVSAMEHLKHLGKEVVVFGDRPTQTLRDMLVIAGLPPERVRQIGLKLTVVGEEGVSYGGRSDPNVYDQIAFDLDLAPAATLSLGSEREHMSYRVSPLIRKDIHGEDLDEEARKSPAARGGIGGVAIINGPANLLRAVNHVDGKVRR